MNIAERSEKLANKITHDISNRRIKLSMEEKVSRIKEFVRMIKKFEEKRSTKCSELLFETILLPEYIKFSSHRLGMIFKWLYHNWKQFSRPFPEIPEFEQARKETSENKGIDTQDYSYANKEYPTEELTKAFSEVKSKLPKKKVDKIKKHSQIALMRRMKAEGKVYSYERRCWVKKEIEDNLPGYVIDPDEKLKRYDSDLEGMRV